MNNHTPPKSSKALEEGTKMHNHLENYLKNPALYEAAPEMLETLKELAKQGNGPQEYKIKELITKAEGETNEQ